MIPRIIHRVAPEVVDPQFDRCSAKWRDLHPDWELMDWRDPLDPNDFETGHLWVGISGAQLANYVRLEVLWRYGGIYVDADVVELVGDVDRSDAHLLSSASRQGHVRWGGFLQNDLALQRIKHALVGLSLLRPYANFTQSIPTKNFEYMSRGVPVIASRLGVADESVEASGGFVSDQGDIRGIDFFIRSLIGDPNFRLKLGAEAHSFVMQEFNWEYEKDIFLSKIRGVLNR